MSKKEVTLTSVWEVRTTLPSHESAVELARALVESKLAACVQISGPIRSLYRWNNTIQDEQEWKLSAKTTEAALDLCMARIGSIHPYDVPEIVADPVHRIAESYQHWLVGEIDSDISKEDVIACKPIKPLNGPWHIQLQLLGRDAVKQLKSLRNDAEQPIECDQWILPSGPESLPIGFESVASKISSWPGMFFEMDGSFVWVSSEKNENNHPLWQIDGMVYDRNGLVHYIELKGRCDRKAWDKFVMMIFSDAQLETDSLRKRLGVHLIQQSAWILESDFKNCIS